MTTLSELVMVVGRVERVELLHWVELGWLVPEQRDPQGEPAFSELDVARARLIRDLRKDLAVEEGTMPLVLALLDQVYHLRHQVDRLTDAIQEQPASVRAAILACLAGRQEGGEG
jgi:chaperone modulatory protein CbpM